MMRPFQLALLAGILASSAGLAANLDHSVTEQRLVPETLHGLSGANCGVNVICEAYYLNDKTRCSDVFIDNLTELSLQAHLFSLSEIGAFLQEGGISVSAVKGCPIDVLLTQIQPSQFSIIHTNDLNGTHNHFLIITSDSVAGKFDILDFPQKRIVLDAADAIAQYKKAFSGDGLLVSRGKATKSDEDKIIGSIEEISNTEDKIAQTLQSADQDDNTSLVKDPSGFSYQGLIKLERDVNDVSKLVGVATLDNESDGPVNIIRAHGECTCFKEAVGLRDMLAKKILTFTVIFDADRFDRIHGSQIILATTIKGVEKDFVIRVMADNPRALASVIAIPSTISFADVRDVSLNKTVNIYIAGKPNSSVNPSVKTTSSFLKAQIINVEQVHLNRQFMTRYSLDVTMDIPRGTVADWKRTFIELVYAPTSTPVRVPITLTSNL